MNAKFQDTNHGSQSTDNYHIIAIIIGIQHVHLQYCNDKFYLSIYNVTKLANRIILLLPTTVNLLTFCGH